MSDLRPVQKDLQWPVAASQSVAEVEGDVTAGAAGESPLNVVVVCVDVVNERTASESLVWECRRGCVFPGTRNGGILRFVVAGALGVVDLVDGLAPRTSAIVGVRRARLHDPVALGVAHLGVLGSVA